jgi:FMN phosphatase YigB (HAD superfamily)
MNYKNLDKLILVDADGVLLDWEWAFSVWMQERGYTLTADNKKSYYLHHHYNELSPEDAPKMVRQFNESAAIGFLPPLRDAMFYVKRLHEEHGYRFHCITSLSVDRNAVKLREKNLSKLFGKTTFERVLCLDTGAPKDEALAEYQNTGCWWIEDKPENALVGHQAGLRSLLIEHGHNMNYRHDHIPLVKNWREVYALITGQSV